MSGLPEFPPKGAECFDVLVRTLDVAQSVGQGLGRRRIREAMIGEAAASPLFEALEVTGTSHADDRKIEALVADEVRERREDLLVGKIAGGAEEHERV